MIFFVTTSKLMLLRKCACSNNDLKCSRGVIHKISTPNPTSHLMIANETNNPTAKLSNSLQCNRQQRLLSLRVDRSASQIHLTKTSCPSLGVRRRSSNSDMDEWRLNLTRVGEEKSNSGARGKHSTFGRMMRRLSKWRFGKESE
ncbi:hypothetical protein AB6A40_009581 [Gnathostoma spinigerum]|uniref:Uncharacterized protein n=1 Tax=Gnathostoma spinigerum TaxID=75299 RepID=A0ABD6EUT4_9BILA